MYKAKTNRIPLRDHVRQEETNREIDEVERQARKRANKMLAEYRARQELNKLKPSQKKQSMADSQKNGGSDFVTLTKDQLAAILSSLTKAQSGNLQTNSVGADISTQHIPSRQQVDAQELHSFFNGNNEVTLDALKMKKETEQLEAISSKKEGMLKRSNKKNTSGRSPGKDKNGVKNAADVLEHDEVFVRRPAKVVIVSDQENNASKRMEPVSKPPASDAQAQEEPFTNQKPHMADIQGQKEPFTNQKPPLIPRTHMTKAELKRLQWEMEKNDANRLRQEINLTSRLNQDISSQLREKDLRNNSDLNRNNTEKSLVQKQQPALVVEPSFVPGLGGTSSDKSNHNDHPVKGTDQSASRQQATAPKFLSKTEIKKLQWERERAQAAPEYNPWGKPSPGVNPAAASSQSAPSGYPSDSDAQRVTNALAPHAAVYALQPNLHPNPQNRVSAAGNILSTHAIIGPTTAPARVPGLNLDDKVTPRPVFLSPPPNAADHRQLRNAMPNTSPGMAAPVRTSLTKAELLKLKWAQDKEMAVAEYYPYGKPGAGAPITTDSGTVLTSYHSRLNYINGVKDSPRTGREGVNIAEMEPLSRGAGDRVHQSQAWPESNANNLQPHQNHTEAAYAPNPLDAPIRTHLRGQLVNLDPITIKQREEQRRKDLLYQEEIKRQVEERQRMKYEEEMRKRREEAVEDEKLREERNNMSMMLKVEQDRKTKREGQQMDTIDILAEAMAKAKHEAEILKAQKRLEKLQRAGHNIEHLKAAYEEKLSPRVPLIANKTPKDLSSKPEVAEPVPPLELYPLSKPSRQTDFTETDHAYITNRTLTPSVYRSPEQKKFSPVKEFGIQTDSHLEQGSSPMPPPKKATQGANSQQRGKRGDKKNRVTIEVKDQGRTKVEKTSQSVQKKGDPQKNPKTAQGSKQGQPPASTKQQVESRVKPSQTQSSTPVEHIHKERSNSSQRKVSNRGQHQSSEISGKPPKAVPATNNKRISNGTSETRKPGSAEVTAGVPDAKQSLSKGYTAQPTHLNGTPTPDFVPFLRSDEVLTPSHAVRASPVSREATQQVLAREAYHKSMQPAQFGERMHNATDTLLSTQNSLHTKDPLFNPSLLTARPTERQKMVLEQLRQMRQGLLAKQREIETDLLPQDYVY